MKPILFAIATLIAFANLGEAAVTNLTLLHLNDHHSHLTESSAGSINIIDDDIPSNVKNNNNGTASIRAYYGGYPRLVTAVRNLTAAALEGGRDVIKLHAGDAITGTTYFTLFEGDADAKLMTHICFDAFAPGNHEFDKGDAGLAKFLTAMKNEANDSTTCDEMPAVLGANIRPGESSPLLGEGVPSIEASRVFTMSNGEKVGVIGIDTKRKTMESFPDVGTLLLDEKETAEIEIAKLATAGVNKIILLTHTGYDNDQEWIAELEGVDVVIGGDSHSLLGNNETAIFGSTRGPYATIITKDDGSITCVVQAWEYSKMIGNLNVDFDDDGNVVSCLGSPIFPMNGDIVTVRDANPRYDMAAADARAVMERLVTMSGGQAQPYAEDEDAANDLAIYSADIEELSNEVVAIASEFIGLEASPAMSGACDLVAQGFLLSPLSTADVAVQNNGGCRVDIQDGNFSINDAYTLLPFSNTMVNLIMTGQQIMNVLEDAIDYVITYSARGAYPRASGLRFDVTLSTQKGSRVTNLESNVQLVGSWVAIDMSANYTVVANSFIASTRDGYSEFGNIDESLVVDTYVEYAQNFIEYAESVETLAPVSGDRASTQNWTDPPPPQTANPTPAPTKKEHTVGTKRSKKSKKGKASDRK